MTENQKGFPGDFSFGGWPPELWDPPRQGSLRIRGELNREARTEEGGRRSEDESDLSSVLIPPPSVLAMAPGRLDRVLESLE